jgi:hypothetical protein
MLPMDQARIRAWMVIRGDFSTANATSIVGLDKGRLDRYVVVRADLVGSLNDKGPGMVVPLDAQRGSETKYEHLYDIRDQIIETLKLGNDDYDLLEVVNPAGSAPPHLVSGYITREEGHAAIDLGERGGKPGRQDDSPGFNPWG